MTLACCDFSLKSQMANECRLVLEYMPPVPFIVANTTGIEKGTTLKFADPMTASQATTDDVVAGIAAKEKIASDGNTSLSVYRIGRFRGYASGTITAGDPLGFADANYLYSNKTKANLSGQRTAGVALETASDGDTFLFELNPQSVVQFVAA